MCIVYYLLSMCSGIYIMSVMTLTAFSLIICIPVTWMSNHAPSPPLPKWADLLIQNVMARIICYKDTKSISSGSNTPIASSHQVQPNGDERAQCASVKQQGESEIMSMKKSQLDSPHHDKEVETVLHDESDEAWKTAADIVDTFCSWLLAAAVIVVTLYVSAMAVWHTESP